MVLETSDSLLIPVERGRQTFEHVIPIPRLEMPFKKVETPSLLDEYHSVSRNYCALSQSQVSYTSTH